MSPASQETLEVAPRQRAVLLRQGVVRQPRPLVVRSSALAGRLARAAGGRSALREPGLWQAAQAEPGLAGLAGPGSAARAQAGHEAERPELTIRGDEVVGRALARGALDSRLGVAMLVRVERRLVVARPPVRPRGSRVILQLLVLGWERGATVLTAR